MALSKQLYLIISFIFIMIFAGNFIISVTNFKDYLQVESKTKSQDTATSLGVRLKPLINENMTAFINFMTITGLILLNNNIYVQI